MNHPTRRPRRDCKPPNSRSLLAFGLLAVIACPALMARTSDRQQQADIEAGHWLDDPERGVQVFSKGVTLTQGTLKITAEKAVVYRSEEGGFSRIVLEGSPAHWQEEMDDGGPMSAKANRIDYDVGKDLVVLREEVVVKKQRDEITGELIRYNLATQRLDAGTTGDGRVRIRITPQKNPDDS